jgi:hypothetical protein
MLCLASSADALEGWERLGTRAVEFRGDHDTIEVGRNEGRFRSIMLEVDGGTIEMLNVRVLFGNGSAFSPSTRLVFNEGERSRVIDLPGDTRIIRSITFDYRSLRTGEGRATVTVYGR